MPAKQKQNQQAQHAKNTQEAKRQRRRARRQRQRQAQAAVQGQNKVRQTQQVVFSSLVGEKEGMALARQMALPEGPLSSLLRVPTVDMPPVALNKAQWTTTFSAGVTAGVLTGFPVVKNEFLLVAYGQPGRSLLAGPFPTIAAVDDTICTFKYPSYGTSAYKTVDRLQMLTMVNGDTVFNGNLTENWDWNPVDTSEASSDASSSYGSIKKRPLGNSNGKTFVYMDPSEKWAFKFYYDGAVAAYPGFTTIRLWQWMGPSETPVVVKKLNLAKGFTSAQSLTVDMSGWYTLDVQLTMADAEFMEKKAELDISIVAATQNPARMVHMWNETLGGSEVGESCRRTAFSVLCTNTTPQMYRGGTIVAARMLNERLSGTDSGTQLGNSLICSAAVASLSQKYSGDAAKGCYTYMDFDQEAERFAPACNNWGNPVFSLDYKGFVNVMLFTPAVVAGGTGQTFLTTLTMVTEFRTDNMMFSPTVSSYSHDALVEARRINNTTTYFYENPLHMSDIWRYIRAGFQAFRRVALPLGIAASTLFPEASGAIMPVAHALQS